MALYALEDIDDALDVTRGFLTPIDRTVWVKLAFVAFFIGGPGASFNSFQYTFGGNGGANGGPPPGDVVFPELGFPVWALIAVVVGVLLMLALLFALIGSVMEFVFVESLRNEAVTVRRYWSRRWRQGLRLFGFRLVIGFVVFGGAALAAGIGFLLFEGGGPGAIAAIALLILPVFVVLGIAVGLVNGFTTVFVVPIMVLEDRNVLAGWRRLWPTITDQWQQYLAYVVASFFLSIVAGILIALVVGVLALLLLIPFGILFAIGVALLVLVSEPLGIAALAIVGVLFGLTVLVVAALVGMPVQAYLRYYAMLVLGDVDPDLDLIPDQRAAVRESSSSSGSAPSP
jgi:hypothetical protein